MVSGAAMAVFGLGIGLAAYVVVTQAAVTSATTALETQASEVGDQLSEHASGDPGSVDLDSSTAAIPTFIQLAASDGTVIASSPALAASDRICPQPLPTASSTDRVTLPLTSGTVALVRLTTQVATTSGPITMCVVTSDDSIDKAQDAVLLALALAIPILVLGVCVVVWLAVGRALRAVDDLTTQADAMQSTADGELRIRQTQDEVERLGHTFNALLTRLHQQTKATRRFVADAGHELRNPLSTLRVTLEFGEEADEAGLRANVREALSDLDRLEVLVQDLLILARTDAMDEPVEFANVDLELIVAEAVATARRSRPDLEYQHSGQSCIITGNEFALRSLVGNLLDNASRHARARVSTRVGRSANHAVIQTDDDGDGLQPEDCQRVFERFVRLDDARDRDEGGSGLGLAIVASIAEAHGGLASATPGPGGHFRIDLPVTAVGSV